MSGYSLAMRLVGWSVVVIALALILGAQGSAEPPTVVLDFGY